MDNGYREIAIGEIKQSGDQYKFRDHDWKGVNPCNHGKEYKLQDFEYSIYRRPIAQGEPNSYTTPTEAIAGNALDATANAHDESKDLQMLFAMAPDCSVAVHPEARIYSEFENILNDPTEWIKIPDRERELNRLADECSEWPVPIDHSYAMPDGKEFFGIDEWQTRRALRHTDVNDTDVVDIDEKPAEWDGWHDFNESQPIEELKGYLVCVQRAEGDCYPYVSVWHDGKWWKTSQMPMPFKITHFKEVEMPKIKTPEQLAAEELQCEIDMFTAYIEHEDLGLWGEKPIKAVANYVQQRLTKKDKGDD